MTTSLEFAGNETTTMYVPYDSRMDIELDSDFTIEWYQYQTDENPNPRIFQRGSYGESGDSITIGVSIESGVFYLWLNSSPYDVAYLSDSDYKNKWVHFSISRNSGIIRVFMDGMQIDEGGISDNSAFSSENDLAIGNEVITSEGAAFGGYLYGFNWITGVGKYTENFEMPTTFPVDENTLLFLTGDRTEGILGSAVVKNNITQSLVIPPNINVVPQDESPDYRMIPYIQAQRRPVLSNNLIFYKPGSLASCGVGGTSNSRVKSRRT